MMNLFALLLVLVTDHGAISGTGTDQTAPLQAAINAAAVGEVVNFASGTYRINPGAGLRIPRGMTLDLRGATLYIDANVAPKSKGIETIPGVSGVTILGGTLRGSLVAVTGLQWSIGFRSDGAQNVIVDGTTFLGWWTDGLWISGSPATPSTNVRLTGITVEQSRRNGVSIGNANGVTVERSVFRGSSGDPGAGIDIEPNVGERTTNLSIYDSIFENNQVGLYMHKGQGTGGENYRVINCAIRGSLKFGLVAHNITKLVIINTRVELNPWSSDVGMALADDHDVVLAFNYARGRNHDFRYAALGRTSLHQNNGRVTILPPGFVGRLNSQ